MGVLRTVLAPESQEVVVDTTAKIFYMVGMLEEMAEDPRPARVIRLLHQQYFSIEVGTPADESTR